MVVRYSYVQEISGSIFLPKRMTEGPLIYAVDHCFGIKGQGTIMTGTILSGKVSINDVSCAIMCIHLYILTIDTVVQALCNFFNQDSQ